MCEKRQSADYDTIAVTPEMIEVGAARFYAHDPRIDDIEEILPDVFRAMLAASKSA